MSSQRISIIHTADFHDRLTPDKAQHLRELKEHYAPCLLLDSGDAVRAGNVTVSLRRERVIPLMNFAGYDAMCLGNREYFFRRRGLLRKTHEAEFIVLAANLTARLGDMGGLGQQKTFRAGGIRVGVFGLAREMIADGSFWDRFSDMVFLDPMATAESSSTYLRQQSDVVVALSHLGLAADRELAAQGHEIDLILGGHDHEQVTFDSARDDPPFISHPGWRAESAAIIELDVGDGKITAARSEIVSL